MDRSTGQQVEMATTVSKCDLVIDDMEVASDIGSQREREELSINILESSPIGIYLLNETRFHYVNPLFEKITGYTRQELMGTNLTDYVHPEDRHSVQTKLLQVLEDCNPSSCEFKFMTKDSRTVWVLDNITNIRYKGKQLILGGLIDINERRIIQDNILSYTRQVETLFNISSAVSQTLNLDELLDNILNKLLQLMNMDVGAVYLADNKTDYLILKAYLGLSAEAVQDMKRVKIGKGLAGQAARMLRPVISDHGSAALAPTCDLLTMEELQSLIYLPISSKERLLGVLSIGNRMHHPFSDTELQLLSAIANQIGTAIDNTQLYQQALELAFTDSLTSLYNRRYLMEQIEREFARAKRSNTPLSLIMIDLDGLKTINDRFGHHKGDTLLAHLGKVIKFCIRTSDVAARWGGDEFMILAPETDSEDVRKIAERIKTGVAVHQPDIDEEGVIVSVSLGTASFPAQGLEVTELLQSVDQAMYSDKRGRGRIGFTSSHR